MLKFKQQKDGPELPEPFQKKSFRSFVDMATFAAENKLPDGKYWIVNDKGTNLWTRMRELTYTNGRFHVDGRGNL